MYWTDRNSIAFRRWILSGPDLEMLQKQFECEYLTGDDPENPKNFKDHEQGLSAQKTFQRQVGRLSKTIRRMGNPFLDQFPDPLTFDRPDCADESVVAALHTLEETGNKHCTPWRRKEINIAHLGGDGK